MLFRFEEISDGVLPCVLAPSPSTGQDPGCFGGTHPEAAEVEEAPVRLAWWDARGTEELDELGVDVEVRDEVLHGSEDRIESIISQVKPCPSAAKSLNECR